MTLARRLKRGIESFPQLGDILVKADRKPINNPRG